MATRNRFQAAALGILLLASVEARAASQEFPAEGIAQVMVRVERADVIVQAAANRISLEAKRLEGAVRRVEDRLEISDRPEGSQTRINIGERLRLLVPPQVQLSLKTASGDITVSGMQARVQVGTASGDIDISDCSGQLNVSGVSGDLKLMGARQDVQVNVVSGNVHGQDISSPLLEMQSVSGDLVLADVSAPRVRLRTVNGNITLKGMFPEGASLAASTVSGDVELWLPAQAGFELSFGSVSGDVSSDFAAAHSERKKGKVQLRVGSGSIQIKVGTVSGDLRLRRLP